MPIGKVRHVGDIVAMVIAGTLDQARDAAEALVVDDDLCPPSSLWRRRSLPARRSCMRTRQAT